MKETIPFVVGKPVTGEYFINREDELARVVNSLSAVSSEAGSNVVLMVTY